MKRIISILLLVAVLLLGAVACEVALSEETDTDEAKPWTEQGDYDAKEIGEYGHRVVGILPRRCLHHAVAIVKWGSSDFYEVVNVRWDEHWEEWERVRGSGSFTAVTEAIAYRKAGRMGPVETAQGEMCWLHDDALETVKRKGKR